MSSKSLYNGHPSHAHWNAALWVGNDYSLYQLARRCKTGAEFAAECRAIGWTQTADGVKLNDKLYRYAWKCATE